MTPVWDHREIYHQKIKKTDEQYEDQYDSLFPDDPWGKVADMMDAPPETSLSQVFISEVEDAYISVWKANESLPEISQLEEYMLDWIQDQIIKMVERDYAEDKDYWANEDYRSDIIEDYETIYWESEGMLLPMQIEEALEYLKYACYHDYEEYMISPAQQAIYAAESEK